MVLGKLIDAVPQLVLDTDMSTDCDDVAAIAIAHTLESRGEARVLGIVHNAGLVAGAGGVSSINHYFGRDEVMIGAYTGTIGWKDAGPHPFVGMLVDEYPGPVRNASQVPQALAVYQNILRRSAENSVTIVSIGFATNLHALLASDGGVALVARKVRQLVIMGGHYPRADTPEWNFGACGPSNICPWGEVQPSARHYDALGPLSASVYKLWPASVPRTFLGFEVGAQVLTGAALTDGAPRDSPVRSAYIAYNGAHSNRQSWDPMTVLYAVRGNADGWYTEHASGYNSVNVSGANQWIDDGQPWNESYLVLRASQREVAAETIDALLLEPPERLSRRGLDHGVSGVMVGMAVGMALCIGACLLLVWWYRVADPRRRRVSRSRLAELTISGFA